VVCAGSAPLFRPSLFLPVPNTLVASSPISPPHGPQSGLLQRTWGVLKLSNRVQAEPGRQMRFSAFQFKISSFVVANHSSSLAV